MDIHERLAAITKRNKKKTHKKYQVWPIEKKVEVVTQWLVLGNLKQTAAISGVSYDLVREWKTQPWWGEFEAEIRQSQNIQTDTKLSKIVEKSLEATLDRVENGDFIYDQKSGQIRRKPAALKDVHRVAVDMIDRRERLREGADNRNEGPKISVEEHLKMLANQMAQWFEPKKQPVIIEEDIEDAIPKEREEGLQAGASMGTCEETGEGEAESGEEFGPEDGSGAGTGSER